MSETKHTPGPWSCRRDAQYYYSVYAGERRVATASDLIADHGKANARLIAAAPDLLAVLHDIVSSYGMRPGHVSYLSRADITALSKAAIAKAEGRSESLPLSKGQEEG